MKRKAGWAALATAVALLLLAGVALATSPASYGLNWSHLLAGGGGETSSSPRYVLDLTVGQSVTGRASSDGYRAVMGYWSGMGGTTLFLPGARVDAP